MLKSKVSVKGPNLSSLIDSYIKYINNYDNYQTKILEYGPISILTYEEGYFLHNSSMMVAIIFDNSNKDKCDIDILSGGGCGESGSKNNAKILKTLKIICETNKWELFEPTA